jgi:chemotaxis protein MotD
MVMQRQVPARPAAKAGDGNGAAGDGRDDAFSAALSQEKRGATADRDRVAKADEASAVRAEADDANEQAAQSDEILNLLTGLMSSASYSDDAALGQPAQGEELPPEQPNGMPAEPEAGADEMAAVIAAAAAAGNKATADAGQTRATAVAKPANAGEPKADGDAAQAQAAAQSADKARAASVQPNTVQSEQRVSAPAAAAQAATGAAAAAAAQAVVQPGLKAPAADTGAERQKDQTSVREVMRALGIEGSAQQPTDAEAAKRDLRSGNGGRQRDVADRRLDDAMGAKGGKVEVVESRKFMPAQNMSANGQLLTRTLAEVGSTAIAAQKAAPAQQLAQTGLPQPGQTLHTLKLQLNPASLGSVTAVLKLTGDDLSVEIKVQTAEAYRQIKEDNQSMLKALRAQGFGVEQISVQHVAGPDRTSSQTPQQGFQASQQGTGSNDAQSSGRESGRNNAGQQGAGNQGGQAHEQASYSGPGTGRTDGVYL